VGCAVALALARRGAAVTLLEAENEPGLAASGTNSGILHTGFDSVPGELETRLILRAAALRDPVLRALGVPVLRCGALVRGVEARNGVEALARDDGWLEIPGEAVTDPVAYTLALARAALRHGAALVTGFRVAAIEPGFTLVSDGGDRETARVVVNCAGLYADEVARMCGDDSFAIYPRKGEFLVFDAQRERIMLPTPTKRTKGVLVFPTIDRRHVIAGPTALDGDDKRDWSVRPEARDEIVPKAAQLWPPIAEAEQVAEYAGLRPAGRHANYVIGPSRACPGLVNVAAIRSTGLTASLGIAEYVCRFVDGLGPEQPLLPPDEPARGGEWWRRTAEVRAA
jgi:glycerol-3-phosphate dehydrogenase